MRALRLTEPQHPPVLLDVAQPDPGPGEVLIRIAGAGACHSDLHLMEWPAEMLPFPLPFTLGHENTGWVEALGEGATGVEVGQPVIVYGPWGCGTCARCRIGMENYCERAAEITGAGGGLGRDGGMADYMLVPSARLLVPLGDLDPVDAAPLADAALTPYHAVRRSLGKLLPGSVAVVIGVGGLGQMGVQSLKATSAATVIAVDRDESKLAIASDDGADHTIVSSDDAAAEIRDLTAGRGADVVLDFVGAEATMALAAAVARPLADVTIVGIAGGTFPFSFFSQPYEVSLATTYWGTLPELREVIALAEAGHLRSKVERFSLDDATTAYEKLERGEITGRAVIVP